jgi:hypothetical protein
MNEADKILFRLRFRLKLIENFVLKLHLLMPMLVEKIPIEDSRDLLKTLLADSHSFAEEIPGQHGQDPAPAGLFADEIQSVIREMEKTVDGFTAEIKAERNRRQGGG